MLGDGCPTASRSRPARARRECSWPYRGGWWYFTPRPACTGNLRLARVAWDGAVWEAVAAHLTVAQGRLTIDDARAQTLGGWLRLDPRPSSICRDRPATFRCTWRPEQLDLHLETGKRLRLLSLVLPIFMTSRPEGPDPDIGPVRCGGASLWHLRWATGVDSVGRRQRPFSHRGGVGGRLNPDFRLRRQGPHVTRQSGGSESQSAAGSKEKSYR